jgi:hypothetical protein
MSNTTGAMSSGARTTHPSEAYECPFRILVGIRVGLFKFFVSSICESISVFVHIYSFQQFRRCLFMLGGSDFNLKIRNPV